MSDEPAPEIHLHWITLVIRALERLPELAFGMGIAVYFVAGLGFALLAAIGALAVSMLLATLHWQRFTYSAEGGQFAIESGVLSRNRRSIPFERVQDISLERKLLARLFGVASVRIETGSSGTDEGMLEYVSHEEADRLRDLVRRYRSGAAAQSGDAATAAEDARPLFAMDVPRLLLFGLFGFSLVFLAVIGGVLQYVGNFFPEDYVFENPALGKQAAAMAENVIATSLLTLAALVILAGFAAGIIRTFARDFGFRLTRTETGLRRERGLFTRTDVVMPLRRVQAAIVSTGIVRRALGWFGLSLQSLGTDGARGTHHDAAPFARMGELAPILAEIDLPLPPDASGYARGASSSIARRTIILALPAILFAAGGLAAGESLSFGAAAVWALLAVLFALAAYRAHGWRLENGVLFVRRGFWRPRATILRLQKLQSATVQRGPLQRTMGLATLALGTAGAPQRLPLRVVDLEEGEARRLFVQLMTDSDLDGAPALAPAQS